MSSYPQNLPRWPALASAVLYMVLSLAVTFLNKTILSLAGKSSNSIASPRIIILLQCLATTLVLGVGKLWHRVREGDVLSSPSALLPMVLSPQSQVSLALKVDILVVVVCFSIYAIAGLQSLGKLPLPLYVAHRHGSVLIVYLLEKMVLREKNITASPPSVSCSTISKMDTIMHFVREDAYVLLSIFLIISGGGVTAVCDFYHHLVGCYAVYKMDTVNLEPEVVDGIPVKVYGWVAVTVISASLYVTLLRRFSATHSISASMFLYDTSLLVSIALSLESYVRGELTDLAQVSTLESVLLACTCILGTLMNIAVYQNTAKNGPLTQTICGIFKNTVSMLAGLIWFNGLASVTRERWKVSGLGINYIGSLMYAWAMFRKARNDQAMKARDKKQR